VGASAPLSGTTLCFDDENARLTNGMGHMLCANGGMEDVTGPQNGRLLQAVLPIAHLDLTVQDGKHLFSGVDVPPVRLIRPVQSSRNAAHVGDIDGAPRLYCHELSGSDDFHVVPRVPLGASLPTGSYH